MNGLWTLAYDLYVLDLWDVITIEIILDLVIFHLWGAIFAFLIFGM